MLRAQLSRLIALGIAVVMLVVVPLLNGDDAGANSSATGSAPTADHRPAQP